MSTAAILTIAIVALVVLGGLFVFATTRSRDRTTAVGALSRETRRKDRSRAKVEAAVAAPEARGGRDVERSAALERVSGGVVEPVKAAPPARREPLDDEAYGVTRRQFFNRGIVTFFALGLSGFGTAVVAFLWPQLSGGFGSKIRVGTLDSILAQIAETREPIYIPEGRFYVNPYPPEAVDKAAQVYSGGVLEGMQGGVVALFQKCPHLGCRVPWCKTSQWFECPCHGSQYNRVGEKKAGPAPRGMDLFGVEVAGGVVSVDTGQVIPGSPIGTDTTGQEAEGPHCA